MRGKGTLYRSQRPNRGITPAHAGKRRSAPAPTSKARDHPRVCGEKLAAKAGSINGMGSPPRVRGKGQGFQVCKVARGTHAGKRPSKAAGQRGGRDYPRACGEKGIAFKGWQENPGSPPRMRGKGRQSGQQPLAFGITPAHAGKSITHTATQPRQWDHPRACGEKKF